MSQCLRPYFCEGLSSSHYTETTTTWLGFLETIGSMWALLSALLGGVAIYYNQQRNDVRIREIFAALHEDHDLEGGVPTEMIDVLRNSFDHTTRTLRTTQELVDEKHESLIKRFSAAPALAQEQEERDPARQESQLGVRMDGDGGGVPADDVSVVTPTNAGASSTDPPKKPPGYFSGFFSGFQRPTQDQPREAQTTPDTLTRENATDG